MKKLSLKAIYKKLLKEEIDFSSKRATVYHLTGLKNNDFTPEINRLTLYSNTNDRTNVSNTPNYEMTGTRERTPEILRNLKSGERERAEIERQNQSLAKRAYEIASNVLNDDIYSLGTSYRTGSGDWYGGGLYTCYKLNPKIARTYGNIILRFEVDLTNFMIFNAGIAKQIHGENWKLEDQLLSILERKGLASIFNVENFDIFLDHVKSYSREQDFLNSTYDDERRTANFALSMLNEFSVFTSSSILLRELIDGLIFYGNYDGPVCLIYRPETATSYNLTGAGYLIEDPGKEEYYKIHDDISELINKKGRNLKDLYSVAYDIDNDSRDREKEIENEVKEKINAFKESGFVNQNQKFNIFMQKEIINDIKENVISDIIKSKIADVQEIKMNEFVDHTAQYLGMLINFKTYTMQPLISVINEFGPGADNIDSSDFILFAQFLSYCYLRRYVIVNSRASEILPYEETFNMFELVNTFDPKKDTKRMDEIMAQFDNVIKVIEDPYQLAKQLYNYDSVSTKSSIIIPLNSGMTRSQIETFRQKIAIINNKITSQLNENFSQEEISALINNANNSFKTTLHSNRENIFGNASNNTVDLTDFVITSINECAVSYNNYVDAREIVMIASTTMPEVKNIINQPTYSINPDLKTIMDIFLSSKNKKFLGYRNYNNPTENKINENIYKKINPRQPITKEDVQSLIYERFMNSDAIKEISIKMNLALQDLNIVDERGRIKI